MGLPRSVRISFFISLLLHFFVLFFIGRFWEEHKEVEAFRARLAYRPRFIAPLRLPVPSLDLPRAQMEYRPPRAASGPVAETELTPPPAPVPEGELGPFPEISEPERPATKASAPQLAQEVLPSPSAGIFVDTLGSEAMELLRIEDMSRADGERAVVIPDVYSRRDVTGYINFTYLRLDGVSNIGRPLDDLARYMRDYTRILARVRHEPSTYFLSRQLLKDPIHFMFPGPRIGGGDPQRSTHLSAEELELLGQYLRGGGFLFIQGPAAEPDEDASGLSSIGGGADATSLSSVGIGADATSAGSESGEGTGWLREMIVHVHDALYPDGRYFEIPPSHPIYHSFYDFDVGFPGEDKMEMLDVPAPAWYFGKGQKDRRGLWGVELDGDLVAVFSDLGLSLSMGLGDETQGDSSVFGLMATTNIVIYALTRPSGLTTVRAQPAWKTFRP